MVSDCSTRKLYLAVTAVGGSASLRLDLNVIGFYRDAYAGTYASSL